MTRLLPAALALGALALPPVVHAAPRPTTAKKAVQGRVRPAARVSRKAAVSPVVRSSTRALEQTVPRGTALTAAALLHYVDRDGRGATDARIAKALDAIPGGRAAAERLANGIRSKSGTSRSATLGRHDAMLGKPTSVKGLRGSANMARKKGFMPVTNPFIVGVMNLLPEQVNVPSNLDLHFTGVRSTKASDADGTDELVVVTKMYDATLDEKHSLVLPSQGALNLAANDTSAQAHVLPIAAGGHFVVTAVAESDGDANQVRADMEVAIELARTLAVDMGSGDALTDFRAALAYTEGMLALSKGAAAPSLHDALYYPSTLQSLWASAADKHGEIEFKTVVEHDAGGGSYELLYDVPSVMPPRKTVRVDLVSIASEDPIHEDAWIRVKVDIHGREVIRDLATGQSSVEVDLKLARGMLSDPIKVDFFAWIVREVPFKKWGSGEHRKVWGTPGNATVDNYIASGWQYVGECEEDLTMLDINPRHKADVLRLTYSTSTNQLDNRGVVLTPKPGRSAIFELSGSSEDAATIELRVFQP